MLLAAVAEDQQERETDLWSSYAAEGISSTSLSDRDLEIRELRQQVQDLTGVLETLSHTITEFQRRQGRTCRLISWKGQGKVAKTEPSQTFTGQVSCMKVEINVSRVWTTWSMGW